MNEERIERLLRSADDRAGPPVFGPITAAGVRKRIHRRRIVRTVVPLTAAAAIALVVLFSDAPANRQRPGPVEESQRMAALEEQVRQLQERTDATLRLVENVLAQDRRQRRLDDAEAELASAPDPMEQVQRQVDKAAFVLIYQADRLYRELNRTESAVAAYKEIIQLFPTNRWAEVARERLAEIDKHTPDQVGS